MTDIGEHFEDASIKVRPVILGMILESMSEAVRVDFEFVPDDDNVIVKITGAGIYEGRLTIPRKYVPVVVPGIWMNINRSCIVGLIRQMEFGSRYVTNSDLLIHQFRRGLRFEVLVGKGNSMCCDVGNFVHVDLEGVAVLKEDECDE